MQDINGDYNIVNIALGNIDQKGVAINSDVKKSTEQTLSYAIDVQEGLSKYALTFYSRWAFRIKLNDKSQSAPALLKKLEEYKDSSTLAKTILTVLNKFNRTKNIASEVEYRELYSEPSMTSLHKETVLRLSKNEIQFETASYKSNDTLNTNLNAELFPSIVLLYFCKTLFQQSKPNIEISAELSTNHELVFIPVGQLVLLSVNRSVQSTYSLVNETHRVDEKISDFENSTIIDLMDKVVECFASNSPTSPVPFLSIDSDNQTLALNSIQKLLFKKKEQ